MVADGLGLVRRESRGSRNDWVSIEWNVGVGWKHERISVLEIRASVSCASQNELSTYSEREALHRNLHLLLP